MLDSLYRLAGSVTGGIVIFALWLSAVLARMPRPPVPPSFAVTLTSPVVTAAGFALGMLAVERLTTRPRRAFLGTYFWALAGCTLGTVMMFPFGGMFAGFGLFGLGTAALLVREVLLYGERGRGGTRGRERRP